MGQSSVGHYPKGKWEFDSSVVAVFRDMIARSIPDYQSFRRTTFDVGRRFMGDRRTVVDLGTSHGDGLYPYVFHAEATGIRNASFLGIDSSPEMLDAARKYYSFVRKPGGGSSATVEFEQGDLADPVFFHWLRRKMRKPGTWGVTNDGVDLFLSLFTLQFVPVEHRQRVLEGVHTELLPGGALILSEKVLGDEAKSQGILVDAYHSRKVSNGYSEAEVEAKRASLQNALVPLKASWNEELLRDAGFDVVEPIWRSLNFCAWLAVKGGR